MKRLQVFMSFVQELDEDISVSSFDERKRLQKLIYVAQEMGINLRYNFGWYKYGPYSSELADDGFTAFSIREPKWKDYTELPDLSEYKDIIHRLKKLLDDTRVNLEGMKESDAQELVASLLFLKLHAYPPIGTKDEAISQLSQYKSFSRKQSETAWKLLKKYKLV
ncbi:MAG: hypothetical protein ACXADH_08915 [Candidatus Kariarchaeaceae archaeon]|jgi:uncharacterized protein YwgA